MIFLIKDLKYHASLGYGDEIANLYAAGNTCYAIAKILGISKSSVEYYVRTRLKLNAGCTSTVLLTQ